MQYKRKRPCRVFLHGLLRFGCSVSGGILFPEGRADNDGLDLFAADLDADLCAYLGVCALDVAHADAYRAAGGHTAGCDCAYRTAVAVGDGVFRTGYAALLKLKAYELAGCALGTLAHVEVAVDEVLALGGLGYPSETGLDGRCGVVDFVAVEAEAHLEAERVARAETCGLDAELSTCLEYSVPYLFAELGVEV